MTFRKVLFWMHLTSGVVAGILILIMCVTGVVLTYERQMNAWADRKDLTIVPSGSRLPVETLLTKVPASATTFGMYSNPTEPAEVALGREGTVFLNPYTGEVIRPSATGAAVRAFNRTMTDWHRWLGSSAETRQRGKTIMDAANLIFFFIVLSGLYLWFPRKLTWKHFRPITFFRGGLSGKARDFNWHNVIGVWSWVPLVAVVGTGVIISYPWASNLLYTLTNSPVPVQQAKGKNPPPTLRTEPANYAGLNAAWARAEQQVPGWKSIRLTLGGNPRAPYSFAIDQGNGGQPQLRSTLTIDRASAEPRTFVAFADGSTGQRLRSIARFTHTGEVLGLTGQTIAGIATLGGAFLVYTGIALAIRRYFGWLKRPQSGAVARDGNDRDSLAA